MPFDDDVRDRSNGTQPATIRRRDDVAGLLRIIGQLGAEERAILHLVAERLHMGQQRFGRFTVATDARDFGQEAAEEVADALVYAACALLRGRR